MTYSEMLCRQKVPPQFLMVGIKKSSLPRRNMVQCAAHIVQVGSVLFSSATESAFVGLCNLLQSTFHFLMRLKPCLSILSLQFKISVLVAVCSVTQLCMIRIANCCTMIYVKVFIAAFKASMTPILLAHPGLMDPCQAALQSDKT